MATRCRRGVLLAAMLCAACAGTPQPAVNSNEVLPGDLPSVNRELSPRESQRVIRAMASTRDPARALPIQPLEQSPHGRWTDVPLAAILAAKSVEMAVVTVSEERDGVCFSILALNNDRGELMVTGDPMHGVSGASATLGLFAERKADADRLVEAFYSHLHELGNVPRPMPEPQSAAVIDEAKP